MTDFEKWKKLALFQNLQITQHYIKDGMNNVLINYLENLSMLAFGNFG